MNPSNHEKSLVGKVLTSLFIVVLTALSNWAYAGNTYYARAQAAIATATGEGKVYASPSTTNNPDYGNGNTTATQSQTTQSGSASFTFYMYARAEEGSEFVGWSETATGNVINGSDTNPYSFTVSSNNQTSPGDLHTRYAIFRLIPTFYFSASAVATPSDGGTASASPSTLNVRGEHWNSTSATTTAIAFSAEPNAGYKFNGWSETADGAIVSTNNPYNPLLTSNSTTSGSPSNTTLYARFEQLPNPTAISTSPSSVSVCVDGDGSFSYSLIPSNAYDNVTVTSGNTSVATVNKNGHDITVHGVSQGSTTITLTAACINASSITTTVDVTVSVPCATPTAISFNNTNNQVTITPASGTTVYYTTNGNDPNNASTQYNDPFEQTTPATIKAVAYRSGYCPSTIISLNVEQVATPTISINTAGVSFNCATSGVTFYYTTTGDDPTTALTPWDGNPVTGLTEGATIKVLATKSGMINSLIASKVFHISSGIEGGVVTLNDREDHTWSYYSDSDCPIHSLNPADVTITYLGNGKNTVSTTNGPTPADNSWTANATTVKVSSTEADTAFVYYKTLERTDGSTSANPTGRCAYTAIPNPFSVRPTYNYAAGATYCGFYKWRVKSLSGGAIYDAANGGNSIAVGGTIDADQTVYFAPSDEYSMEVELEALWARAYVVNSNTTTGLNANVSYERNFVYLSGNTALYGNGLSVPVTYTTLDPATGTGTKRTITFGANGNNNNVFTCQTTTKFENATLASYNNNTSLSANKNNLIIGRGCTGTVNSLIGLSGDTNGNIKYTLRLESGTIGTFNMIDGSTHSHSGTVTAKAVFGCDYDRANDNDNTKLSIAANSTVYGASSYQTFSSNANRNNLTYDWLIKSGKVQASKEVAAGAAATCIYMGNSGSASDLDANQYQGKRRLIMEGGEVCNIAGGLNNYGNNYATYLVNDGWTVQIRIKGGTVRGSVFGAAEFAGASGDRQFIFTGGTINGWVAGGCNGTHNDGGELYGSTALYIGGRTEVGTSSGGTHVGGNVSYTENNRTYYGINGADGGNVFGAGCGINPTNSSYVPNGNYTTGTVGRVDNSVVVVADEAHVWRDVHGGGNYGWVRDDHVSDIYIAGGIIGGNDGHGNVFGGSNNQQGQEVSITVKGGDVKGGVYGGSHSWGTINDNVTMSISGGLVETGVFGGGYGTTDNSCDVTGTVNITMTGGTVLYGLYGGGNVNSKVSGVTTVNVSGGTVGADNNRANVHGGGLGSLTRIRNNVVVKIGADNATSGATIYGDVYGGSAEGKTNGNTSLENNATTAVTLNAGTIHGSLYGGGLGTTSNPADVYGPVTVVVNGGSVTKPENNPGGVFGCNNAAGSPQSTVTVTVNATDPTVVDGSGNKTYAINGVYGGGNEAHYNPTTPSTYPTVTINGCESSIKDVYGGGNAAAVPYTKVTINGGDIDRVFGGGNGEDGIAHVGYMNNDANPSGSGYGAGTAQAIIKGGTINQVFGGSNANGVIRESISVNVDKSNAVDTCAMKIGEVYGGGNMAASQAGSISIGCTGDLTAAHSEHPENIGSTLEGIGAVYGGANAAKVTGNITLNITSGMIYRVFGGNNTSNTVDGEIVVNINKGSSTCGWYVGYVYGGGNNAPYSRAGQAFPKVNILAGTVSHDVFGAGKGVGASVVGNPVVTLSGSSVVGGDVYGGGDQGAVTGETKVEIKD